jgi:cyclopropane fatty-acyl-phospholipid synthase-like methyltransferase
VSIITLTPTQNLFLNCLSHPDYPRTLREWGRRLDSNLTKDLIAKDYPALQNQADYDAFKRKWQYLFAYAGAGFAQGYITCHMLTFIREVSPYFYLCIST